MSVSLSIRHRYEGQIGMGVYERVALEWVEWWETKKEEHYMKTCAYCGRTIVLRKRDAYARYGR